MKADEVKQLRKANGLTQHAFGRKLGYSRIAVNNWENERTNAPKNLLDQIAAAGLFTYQPQLTKAYGIYSMYRDQMRLNHLDALHRMASDGCEPLTRDDMLMLVRKYPSILGDAK